MGEVALHPTVDNRTDKQTWKFPDGSILSMETGDGSVLTYADAVFLLTDVQYQLHKLFHRDK